MIPEKLGGYTGRILRIDLSNRKINYDILDKDIYQNYLGGPGLASWILYNDMKAGIDEFSEENEIVFMTGPLIGAGFLSTPKCTLMSKSPLTGFPTDSFASGMFGHKLKWAGFDGIVICGKASEPSYIYIDNKKVEIRGALHLWGAKTSDTISLLEEEISKNIEVACIGPAGENLVRYACVIAGRRAFGRGGLGAVLGSKLIKAVVINTEKNIVEPYDKKGFSKAKKSFAINCKEKKVASGNLAKYGTSYLVELINSFGILPNCNFRFGTFNQIEDISGPTMLKKLVVRSNHCSPCPIPCEKISLVRNGFYSGTLCRGPEYETIWAFGPQCCNNNLELIAACAEICDEFGLDTISAGNTIGFALEAKEKGLLSGICNKEELSLLSPRSSGILEVLKNISYKRGFGNLLSEGVYRVAQKLGGNSESFAMHVKGMEIPAYDPRGAIGMGLAYATSSRGACHLKAWTISEELSERYDRYSICGKALLVKTQQDYRTMVNAVGLCFNADSCMPKELMAETLKALIGFDFTIEDLSIIGERIWNLQRILAVREGISANQDNLPNRFFNEKLPDGPAAGHSIQAPIFKEMLREYYKIREWDINTGIPKDEKLKALKIKNNKNKGE